MLSLLLLLGRALAWKLKKPLALPFLDFSTPALRRHFCEEELGRRCLQVHPPIHESADEGRGSDREARNEW